MSKNNSSGTIKDFFITKGRGLFDYDLLAAVILLGTFGLIMLYSASSYDAFETFDSDTYYLLRQGAFFIISVAAALILSKVNYHSLVYLARPIYALAFGLMLLVFIIGSAANGSQRWLQIGPISFQPAEVAKIAVILILAYMITASGKSLKRWRNYIFLFIAILIQFLGAYKLTDNLSTAVIILGIGMGILLIYYPKTERVFLTILIAVVALALFLLVLRFFPDLLPDKLSGFRITRILNWFDSESSSSEGSYQVMQALYAIGSGGPFGKGLGNSTQKISRIPEAQNDMIFSIICEELGLFGAILLLVLFGYFLYRLFFIAQNAPDLQGSIIASGIFIHFSLQIILNIAVVLNLIPTTGISLPLVSYGGTALLFQLAEVGICLNISRQIRLKKLDKSLAKA